MAILSFLDRDHTIAAPGYSRWLVPPGRALYPFVHRPGLRLQRIQSADDKVDRDHPVAPDDWKLTDLGWIFSIAIVVLGLSAAFLGRWVEEGGPRRAMFTAGLCFGGGFLVSAAGIYTHNLWVVYLGYGVLGGCGLGLGYISPVSTLIKWFPDRPGMATGMAIMGFGGAAFIASPLSVWLMAKFSTPTMSASPKPSSCWASSISVS